MVIYTEINVHEKELCVKLVVYKDYTERHGQQNIKFYIALSSPCHNGHFTLNHTPQLHQLQSSNSKSSSPTPLRPIIMYYTFLPKFSNLNFAVIN
jgi:hypothetical protein